MATSDGSESRHGIESAALTRHFLDDSYSILLDESRLGVGRVSFSAIGLGFGFLDFARVGFRVKEIWFG